MSDVDPVVRYCYAIFLLWCVPFICPAATFDLPENGDNVVGESQYAKARYEDTLVDLARLYNVGLNELKLANPSLNTWLPGTGNTVVIPTRYILPDAPRQGVVINIPEMRLYYYPESDAGEPRQVITYPVSVGRQDWQTPKGITRIVRKVKDPAWYPPKSIREEHAADGRPLGKVVPPGPDNPLGQYALRLGIPGYLIHGTNRPNGVGMQVTHGCIRLFPEDIEALYGLASVGTPVRILNQPYKAGWRNGDMYLEIHPPLDGSEHLSGDLEPVIDTLRSATQAYGNVEIDWKIVEDLVMKVDGIPHPIASAEFNDRRQAQHPLDEEPASEHGQAVDIYLNSY